MDILLLALGLLLGFLLGFVFVKRQTSSTRESLDQRIAQLDAEIIRLQSQAEAGQAVLQANIDILTKEKDKTDASLLEEQAKSEGLSVQLARSQAESTFLKQKLEDQKKEIEEIQIRFRTEFENTANRLFKQHSTEFNDNSTKNLGELLNPLKERIQKFEQKVDEAYDKEMRDRISLKEEVKQLFNLNQKISEEAHNLTRALKGDVKKMGNWGEVLLERILEQSGLEKDTMYKTQVSSTTEEGKRYQPDVIIYLPDKKHIIIDSKVSLLAYEKYVNAETEEERAQFAKEHLLSMRNHILSLSSKTYQDTDGLNSPDFVLLFIPIEASFSVAIREDIQLFDLAWKNKIVMVSPSTLLATLKTIQSIWKQENQNRNAMEIARQGAGLYDKFVGFMDDLGKIGSTLQSSQQAYEEAVKKLSTGKGNLVGRVENLRKLGLKPAKALPEKYLDSGELSHENPEEEL